jgi:hypothetical protein
MKSAFRHGAAALLISGLWVSAPACASGTPYYGGRQNGRVVVDRRAYDEGYRSGLDNGERDARDRRSFKVDRSRDYRSADRGYDRRANSRDDYSRFFREGYEAGYTDGFNRIARSGRYDQGRRR